ncbi:MAG: hypothetical protein LBS60_04135, partial [Deltaproteobacteria bacterium]|nr:hypothetical protein [Deltaproteobacteria bacterium]
MSGDNNDAEKNDKETFETFEQFIERLRDICRKLGLDDIQLDRIDRPRQILDRLCKLLVLSDRKGLLIELRFIDINTPLEDILITEVNSEIIDKYATLKRLDSVFIFKDIKRILDKNINVCMTEFESVHKVENTVKHFGYLASMLGKKYVSKKYALNISYVIIYGPQINPIVDYRLNINSQKYEPNCLFLSDTDEDKFFQEKFEKVRSGQKLSPVELMRLFTL